MEKWTKVAIKPRADYQWVWCLTKSPTSNELLVYKGYWNNYNKEWRLDAPSQKNLTVVAWRKIEDEIDDILNQVNKDNQPFLCNRLGVSVNEWFKIRNYDMPVKFRILENGLYETEPEMAQGSSVALLKAIENPNRIKKLPANQPKWTLEDIDTAESIKKLWPNATAVKRLSATCVVVLCAGCTKGKEISSKNFTSIPIGKEYSLDEIIHPERYSML